MLLSLVLLSPLRAKALSVENVRELFVGAGRVPLVGPIQFAYEITTKLALSEPSLRLGVDVEVADSPGRGKGLFALRSIGKDELVGPYLGPIKKWSDVQDDVDNSYLFQLDDNLIVDGSDPTRSNWVRYFNHSKRRQNCYAETIESNSLGGQRIIGIALRTSREISEGEELFFDYGDDYWNGKVSNPLTRFKIHYG